MKSFHLLIKPAGGSCNMRCKYCFYADVSAHRETENFGMMSISTMQNMLERALKYTDYALTLSFQGGEPTLRGLDFFKEVVSYVKSHNKKNLKITYAIQTNGICIDKEWASFFAKNNFLVGLSLDGIKDTHDCNRVDSKQSGTFYKIMEVAALFDKFKVQYNILTVINDMTAKNIKQIYKFYLKRGFVYQQYIPCLDELGKERGQKNYSLTPSVYEQFLKDRFDMWYEQIKRGNYISDRLFENWIWMLKGRPPESCGMIGRCGFQTVVEADGSVYPCDFYVLDEYRLGNVNSDSFDIIDEKRNENNFYEIGAYIHNDCNECKWYPLCRGGCRRDRLEHGEFMGKNYYCTSFYNFFEYAYDRLALLAEGMR